MVMDYMKVPQAAARWQLSERYVRVLCQHKKIPGAMKIGRAYLIPSDSPKPTDGRKPGRHTTPNESAARLVRIDACKEGLNQRRLLTTGELQWLMDGFMAEYVYHSNALEGNTLTLQETALVLAGQTIENKPLKDHLEAVGHRDAFLYMRELVQNRTPISEAVIKRIHGLILMDKPEDKGVYRQVPVRLKGVNCRPPAPVLVPEMVKKLVAQWPNKQLHPIENAALFHLKFAGIQPFLEGNGQVGRLILNLLLLQERYPPVNIRIEDRKRYHAAIDRYYRDGDISAMVSLIGADIERRLEELFFILV